MLSDREVLPSRRNQPSGMRTFAVWLKPMTLSGGAQTSE